MRTRQRRRSAWLFRAFAAALLAACNLDASGLPPPPGNIAFPTGLALSREPTPRTLFVANSNFDLSHSAGSVQGYDLARLEGLFAYCRAIGQRAATDASIEVPNNVVPAMRAGMDGGLDGSLPGPESDGGEADAALGDAGVALFDGGGTLRLPAPRELSQGGDVGVRSEGALCLGVADDSYAKCCLAQGGRAGENSELAFDDVLRNNEVLIDSFATGLAVSPDNRRLYVPISSRSRLVYLDLAPNADGNLELRCGDEASAGDRRRCTRGPGRGRDDDDPEQEFPGQPSAIAVGRLADLGINEGAFAGDPNRGPHTPIVMTAHETGGLSLYVESRATAQGLALDSFPTLESVLRTRNSSPSSVFIDSQNHLAYVTASGAGSRLQRFGARVFSTPSCDPELPGACQSGSKNELAPREILYATSSLQIAGVAAGEDLRDVAADPNDPSRLFVLSRGSPRSVLFVRLDTSSALGGRVTDVVRVGAGPSKLRYVSLGGRPFLLVSGYDARTIAIVDASSRKLVAEVRNLSGPFQLAVDEARRLLYVADFRTSAVRVIDLEGLLDRRKLPPRIIATLGALQFTRSLR